MFGITSCVLRLFQVNNTIVSSLRTRTLHETITLCCIGVLNETLLGFEVESHGLTIVFFTPLFEEWFAMHSSSCVNSAIGLHHATIHVHRNLSSSELHVLIFHFCFTKEEC